jgi:D-methionine transport system substrate-binding protein
VINGNYALEAGLTPAKDALGLESASHNPYANILVTIPPWQTTRASNSWRKT